MELTNKQLRFCEEYLIDLNGAHAAVRAGYSARSANRIAHENLCKPHVRARIDELMAAKDAELVATSDEVLRYLTSVMRGEDAECKVLLANGMPTSEDYVSQANRIKAAELLAKCHGLMVQRVDVGEVQMTFVDDLPPDDG